MGYRLHYWGKRGRGEQIRLLLRVLGQPLEDIHLSREKFILLQGEGPSKLWFSSIPLLEDDDFRLVQAPVILSYLARKHGLAPADLRDAARADAVAWGAEDLRIAYFTLWHGHDAAERQAAFVSGPWRGRWLPNLEGLLRLEGTGFFVGASLTHADVAVWDALNAVLEWVPGATLGDTKLLPQWYERFRARPEIAAYLASPQRPKS